MKHLRLLFFPLDAGAGSLEETKEEIPLLFTTDLGFSLFYILRGEIEVRVGLGGWQALDGSGSNRGNEEEAEVD